MFDISKLTPEQISALTPETLAALTGGEAAAATEAKVTVLASALQIRDDNGKVCMVAEPDESTPSMIRFRDTDSDGVPKVHAQGKQNQKGEDISGKPKSYRRLSKVAVQHILDNPADYAKLISA